MKEIVSLFKRGIATILAYIVIGLSLATGQMPRDLQLTGGPDNGNYPGYEMDGVFNLTFTNAPPGATPLQANSLRIVITLPSQFEFASDYTPPVGWTYSRAALSIVHLIQSGEVMSSPPQSIVEFHVPFRVVGAVQDGVWSAQIQRVAPTYQDPDDTNNSPLGTVSVVDAPLPVKLTTFKAAELEGQAHVSWGTTEEVNFDRFEVQRSTDVKSGFATVGKISAKGVNGKGSNYGFTDREAPKGQMLYYRLRMVDTDGTVELSHIESLELSGVTASVYPNPATSFVRVSATEPIQSLELISMSGHGLNKTRYAGDRKVETLELRNTPSGIYQVKIEGISGKSVFRKVVVGE